MLFLLAIFLSVDAFAVSIAYGLKATRIPFLSKTIICFISIFYFAAAVWLGNRIAAFFSPETARILGIVLMSAIGFWMLLQVLLNKKTDEDEEPKTVLNLSLRPLGLTFKIIRDPMLSDVDHSGTINSIEAIFLGTALSVDSISVGIGYSLLGDVHFYAPFLVGLFQFLFLWAGNLVGLKCTTLKFAGSNRLQIVSVAVIFTLVLVRIFQ